MVFHFLVPLDFLGVQDSRRFDHITVDNGGMLAHNEWLTTRTGEVLRKTKPKTGNEKDY